jgi:HAD superfamily hydrolase (TIGR01484 family)
MRYHALACDYDGTVARNGQLAPETRAALEDLRRSGRRVLLVTGRELDDLRAVCGDIGTFDAVVAENGAVLYLPAEREERLLAEPPPPAFVDRLRERGVAPLSTGRAIVATWHPHEAVVLATILEMGLELQVVFNKGAVMVLPSGVNKATGMAEALAALGLSPHNVVAIGDAENDHAFLAAAECSVSVANALPTLKERSDLVTAGRDGQGTVEIARRIESNDLADVAERLHRHDIALGHDRSGGLVHLPVYGSGVLVAGTSGSGKSTLATGIIERLIERRYQTLIVDPEGDYSDLEGIPVLGGANTIPTLDEVARICERPEEHLVVNLLGIRMGERPSFFAGLLAQLQALRGRSGRPHWLVLDEAHHLVPADWRPAEITTPQDLQNLLMLTVHAEKVSPAVLGEVTAVLAVGDAPGETVAGFASALGERPPPVPVDKLEPGEAILWWRKPRREPLWIRTIPPRGERRRHVRKYAQGELGHDNSFFFRGPGGRLNLRAQNLNLFLQIGEGVDDDTWRYHLQAGDYSSWMRQSIKDASLAAELAALEAQADSIDVAAARRAVREAIERRYTGAA